MTEYNNYLEGLRELIKDKGILVETKRYIDFLSDTSYYSNYKKNLGAVTIYDNNEVTNIYVAFEGYDGNIYYYDYLI